jgi:NRAMP (natural resistance-associated macrophage protein)-like metal ion transporter
MVTRVLLSLSAFIGGYLRASAFRPLLLSLRLCASAVKRTRGSVAKRTRSGTSLLDSALERRRQARAAVRRAMRRTRRGTLGVLRRRYARLLAYLSLLGPGLISGNAGNDAGGIATYASAGASYGYSLLWAMFIIAISLAVVQEMCARMGAVTGKGLSDLIRENFGIRWTFFAMAGLLVANTGVALSEFIGIAAAADLFSVPRWLIVPLSGLALWLLVVFGSYRTVERFFLVLTCGFFAYPIAALLARPVWGDVAHGVFIPSFRSDPGYIQIVVALIGTTITPYLQLFVQSSVAEKGVSGEDYQYQRFDTYTGSAFAVVIAAFIIIATGATLFVQGVEVTTAEDAARALQPVAGDAAEALFGVGLFGACMLAGAVLPLTTAYSLSEAFGFEKGISRGFREAPVFMGVFTGLIALGVMVALIPDLPIISILLVIQIVNGILSPIVLISALRLSNDPEIMGERRNGPVARAIATVTVAVIVALTVALLVMTALDLWL